MNFLFLITIFPIFSIWKILTVLKVLNLWQVTRDFQCSLVNYSLWSSAYDIVHFTKRKREKRKKIACLHKNRINSLKHELKAYFLSKRYWAVQSKWPANPWPCSLSHSTAAGRQDGAKTSLLTPQNPWSLVCQPVDKKSQNKGWVVGLLLRQENEGQRTDGTSLAASLL